MQWPYIKHPAQSTSYTDTPSNLLSLYVTKPFEIWVPRKFGLKFQQWQVCSNVGHVSIWIIVIPTLTFWHLHLSGTFQNLRPCHFSILHGLSYTYLHCRRACGHGDMGTCPHQDLAVSLTLFHPCWGGDHTMMSPLSFESHRCACIQV